MFRRGSYHTAKTFKSKLGHGFAHVQFGKHELLLQRDDERPCVLATLLAVPPCSAGESAAAFSPAIERLELLVEGVMSRFVNLRCTALLRHEY